MLIYRRKSDLSKINIYKFNAFKEINTKNLFEFADYALNYYMFCCQVSRKVIIPLLSNRLYRVFYNQNLSEIMRS